MVIPFVYGTHLAHAALMVSRVKFNSFKDLDLAKRVPLSTVLLAVLLLAVVFVDPPKVLSVLALLYSSSGVVFAAKRIWRVRQRRG